VYGLYLRFAEAVPENENRNKKTKPRNFLLINNP
jgi:hypothetical protein